VDILSLLSQYVDGYAVIIALFVTQMIKALLPTPPEATGKFKAFAVGNISYRFLPFIPLVVGLLVVYLKDSVFTPTLKIDDAIVKGIVSGIGASYLYRTAKVTLFGAKDATGATEEEK